jgi:hypothetical protein
MPSNYIVFHADEFKPKILEKSKTETLRYGWESLPEEGSTVKALSSDGDQFALLKVTNVEKITVQEAVNRTFDGHRNYDSVDECATHMSNYYEHEFKPETELILIEFELAEEITVIN